MKPVLFVLFIMMISGSCMLNTKIDPGNKLVHVLETQMAEIKAEEIPEIEILKKDTLEFLKFWQKFFKYYQENDISGLISLSYDSVHSPLFIEAQNRFQEDSGFVSIADLLNAAFRNKLNITTVPFSKNDPLYIIYRYEYNQDPKNKRLKKDSVVLNYHVLTESREIKGSYEIRRSFIFSFIKKNSGIKFSGLESQGEAYSRPLNDSTTRANLYFPLHPVTQYPITNLNSLDTFTNLWYSASLRDFNEPNLFNYKGPDEIYRFTWLRSFHVPVAIRFQKQGDKYMLTTKKMIAYDGDIPYKFVVTTIPYLASQWDKLESKLGRYDFWNRPTLDPEEPPMDGAEWILEANIKGKYHFTTRHTGDAVYKDCCKYLLLLSKLKIPKEAMY
jgi:hypothetical protein